jgi:acyl-CoA reductase-like NAD-dependent aldehyde dehydrogenase
VAVAEPPASPKLKLANYVNGEWSPSVGGAEYERENPWRPDDVLGRFPDSDERDVAAAVEAAAAAFPAWSALPMARRAEILSAAANRIEARVDAMTLDMVRETGKPVTEARGEAARVAHILRYSAGEAFRATGERFQQAASGQAIYTVRRPVGVVALITPWNFPAAVPAWKLAPALIWGNTVVMKPAEASPMTALHIAAALDEAGMPPGVFNVVLGHGPGAGAPLVRAPRVAAISFTGSSAVGERLRDDAVALGKAVQLELGGSNPMIVAEDADLQAAADAAYAGAFWSAGQKCMSTRRLYVQEKVIDELRERLVARMGTGIVGDPLRPDTEVGPVVTGQQLSIIQAELGRAVDEGGTVIAGGDVVHSDAYLLSPALVDGLGDDAYLSHDEVFGPVLSLYSYSDLSEAIAKSNDTRYGLSASMFTNSLSSVKRFVNEVRSGVLRVNQHTVGAEMHVPFGGVKESGYGPREQGRGAIEFYTELVTVYETA